MITRSLRISAICAAFVALAACSGGPDQRGFGRDGKALESYTAEQIFERAEYEMAQDNLKDAAFYFAEIERLYPYSELAKRALIMQAFAFHKGKDYDSTRSTAARFIAFYPADKDAAYAQYLLGLSYYDQISEVGRDQSLTVKALEELRKVSLLYPDSEYAKTAQLKFDLAYDHLAAKEMEVGRYYLARKHYAAAANRFRVVVEDFQTSTHTAEALHRLVETYLALGLTEDAQTAGAVLGHNFQASEWYKDSYALLTRKGVEPKGGDHGWLGQIYRQTIQGKWL
jgi:outer membrane protein assembly factor BamD